MISAHMGHPGSGMTYGTVKKPQPRDYTPPPLAYPYRAFPWSIPFSIQDRLYFKAFNARRSGVDLGVFMVRAWEEFRFPHIKIMHALQDMGCVHRVNDRVFGQTWEWFFAPSEARPQRSEDAPQDEQKSQILNIDLSQPFISSVVVAPKISPMGWTPL